MDVYVWISDVRFRPTVYVSLTKGGSSSLVLAWVCDKFCLNVGTCAKRCDLTSCDRYTLSDLSLHLPSCSSNLRVSSYLSPPSSLCPFIRQFGLQRPTAVWLFAGLGDTRRRDLDVDWKGWARLLASKALAWPRPCGLALDRQSTTPAVVTLCASDGITVRRH